MKVYNLRCEAGGHGFEGWFASQADYEQQKASGLLCCPVCGSAQVEKTLSAPRLNLKGGHSQAEEKSPALQAQARLLQLARELIANTEDVGERFAEEARKMHYQESEARNIRGKVSADEREALLDEGIAVLPLPILEGMDGPLQ
ncbi:DUF1178 family protein [Massilia sp. W12]|uniref:DUF1178 family protein n=1 Tax=Massilia sp. W12 TaxID=3126507 RepID=UPI0030CD3910